LLISQIENEQFLKEDTVSLDVLLQEVHDEISIRIEEKGIRYTTYTLGNLVLTNVNKYLLFNLFFNLVNNAIKYNREGGQITISSAPQSSGLLVSIADTGIGISPQNLPHIFNRFKKLHQSLQQDSFGLGLPIVKSIAAFHHIQIEVASEKDQGTTFKLIFPPELVKGA